MAQEDAKGDALPRGTVTFLLTDIEGSTRLWERDPAGMRAAIQRHDEAIGSNVSAHGGVLIKERGEGDSHFAVFADPADAAAAAVGVQRIFATQAEGLRLRVRIALHTGTADVRDGDYVGVEVNRGIRLRDVAHGGQTLVSASTAPLVRDRLPGGATLRDLGPRRLRDLARPEGIFELDHPELESGFPPLRTLDELPTNLPVQLTSFIGREDEMGAVATQIRANRLVTLTGPGGVGKTRLALHVAAEILDEFPDGAWLADLARVTDDALVPTAVARALALREEPGRSLIDTLAGHLRSRTLLLILDNCEHLVDGCAGLAAALLQVAPGLRILATSREALGVPGEVVQNVPSLSSADPERLPSLETLSRYESVRLFVERAAACDPSIALTPETATAVAQICHRLDGIALAIELAAARVTTLAVPQIAERLDDRFRLLAGGSRAAVERQRTLRATVDWSYALLTEAERALLRRLAAFMGTFTLEAAEEVAPGGELDAAGVLDLLASLVAKSLLVADTHADEARYRLLETIREYALEKLVSSGEVDEVRVRHRDHYLTVVERAEQERAGNDVRASFDRLEADHDNIRAALDWSISAGDGEAALRLACAVSRYWEVRGHFAEGRRWLSAALNRATGAGAELRSRGLRAAGTLAWHQGDYAVADWLLNESLQLRRTLGDEAGIAESLAWMGLTAWELGDRETSEPLFEEALAVARRSDSRAAAALALTGLASIATGEDDYVTARPMFTEALAIMRELGHVVETTVCLRWLGTIEEASDIAKARALFEEALTLATAVGDKNGIAISLRRLAKLARDDARDDRAKELFDGALAIARESGSKANVSRCLSGLSELTLDAGDARQARALAEEALAVARETDGKWNAAQALLALGRAELAAGNTAPALEALREAVALWSETGERLGRVECLEALAEAALSSGNADAAARRLAAAQSWRDEIGAVMPPGPAAARARLTDRLREALGEESLAFASSEGRRAGFETEMRRALAGTAAERSPERSPS